jgi:hypothetical protein
MERFKEKAEESIDHNKPLECFGYYLPAINFAELLGGRSFAQPAYFNEATFTKDVNCSEATFSEVDFRRATFSEVDFRRATFTKDVNCSEATFSGRTYYLKTRFLGVVDFEGTTFSGGVFLTSLHSPKEQTFLELSSWMMPFSQRLSFQRQRQHFSGIQFLKNPTKSHLTRATCQKYHLLIATSLE